MVHSTVPLILLDRMEKFDYAKAIEELEAIAAVVENPDTGIADIDKYMKRSKELVAACREYLRGARETLENNETV